VVLGREGSEERRFADGLYEELEALGLSVLYDDRDAGPGEKFAVAELLGCPLRLTVGKRSLASGEIETQVRRGQAASTVPVQDAAAGILAAWGELP